MFLIFILIYLYKYIYIVYIHTRVYTYFLTDFVRDASVSLSFFRIIVSFRYACTRIPVNYHALDMFFNRVQCCQFYVTLRDSLLTRSYSISDVN